MVLRPDDARAGAKVSTGPSMYDDDSPQPRADASAKSLAEGKPLLVEIAGNNRLFSLDAARGFAIIAMVVAHTAPFVAPAPKVITLVEGLLNDVAAPLFALIIGVTLSVTSNDRLLPAGARTAFRRSFALKALVLIGLGFALEIEPSGVNIVLDFLGVTMLLSLPLIFLRSRTLLCWAAGILALTPGVVTFMRTLAVTHPDMVYPSSATTVVLDWLFLGRSYQVPIFLGMLLLGIVLGRMLLGGRLPHLYLFAVSAAGFMVTKAVGHLVVPDTSPAVRGGYLEVLGETALALLVFTAIVFICDQATGAPARTARRVFAFASVQGRMALSIYVFHVGVLILIVSARGAADSANARWFESPRGWLIQIGLVLLCWLFAAAWSRWFGSGPLEQAIGRLSGRRKQAIMRKAALTTEPH